MSLLSRLAPRGARPPSERDWERSAVLEPRVVRQHPELISDGGGLPFPPAALTSPPEWLDPDEPAVAALIAELNPQTAVQRAFRAPWKGDAVPPPARSGIEGWRVLARSDEEVLFGRGQPPELLTVAVRQAGRSRTWKGVGVSRARPLRAARDGVRASSWRLDPAQDLAPSDTLLRVLVTEQTYSGAQRADGRVLAPDLYVHGDELVLTMFVTPRPGFQVRAPNPETGVRVALPQPVGARQLIDGALYEPDS